MFKGIEIVGSEAIPVPPAIEGCIVGVKLTEKEAGLQPRRCSVGNNNSTLARVQSKLELPDLPGLPASVDIAILS